MKISLSTADSRGSEPTCMTATIRHVTFSFFSMHSSILNGNNCDGAHSVLVLVAGTSFNRPM